MSDLAIRERVAREVMGLREVRLAGVLSPTVVFDNGMTCATVPAYESDIAAAWLVVEEMRKRGRRVFLYLAEKHGGTDDRGWHCQFGAPSEGDTPWGVAGADTAPLAICLAALAAVEAR